MRKHKYLHMELMSIVKKIFGNCGSVRSLSLLLHAFVFCAALVSAACSTPAGKQNRSIEAGHTIAVPAAWSRTADINLIGKGRVMVALALGQSNSANFGETLYNPKHEVYSYYRGNLYRAGDPMYGADGLRGSVWSRFADLVIESGMYDRVVFVTAGIGGTSVQCWTDGECSEYLRDILEDLHSDKIRLTHIFWHQGEQDNLQNTGHAEYTARMTRLLAVIREYGQDAPMYVSIASYHPHNLDRSYISDEVRRGQADFINGNRGVLCGPDTDRLVSKESRYDGVHFSGPGLDSFALLWLEAVRESSELSR